ncbi:F-box domain containing protein [Pandoravirus macleodensis]|uniref:F-box domain containing protein n=1 Tax=Pandoravirus macleodensis TaxID=2107707 RepID=A0A2U7UFT1_9VIRU|nr:F-box domain containing protein [Pandoravirus macleodensis]AVK77316.1 F-box domain containing protein [Pandoravirus macleodensis]
MDRRRIPVGLCVPKKTRTIGVGQSRHRRTALKHTRAVKKPSHDDARHVFCLTDLPNELVEAILRHLPGRDLAAAALVCTALHRVSDCERIWEAAYRRDIDADGPPIQHRDHLAYGKSTRWLYGLMRLPEGILRVGPTGRLTGRLTRPDGITSGEFTVGPPTPTTPHALLLDGYGANLTRDTTGGSTLHEGFFKCGAQTDRGRYASFSSEGDSVTGPQTRVAKLVRCGPIQDGLHHGICRSEWASGEYAVSEFVRGAISGRSLHVTPDGYVRSGQRKGDVWNSGRGVERLADGTLNEYAPGRGNRDNMSILVSRAPRGLTRRALPSLGPSQDASEHIIDYGLGPDATVSTDGAGNMRVQMRGYVIVADRKRILFVAVDVQHNDRVAAGRRWIANMSSCPSKDAVSVLDDLANLVSSRRSTSSAINAIVGLSHATYNDLSAIFDGAGLETTVPCQKDETRDETAKGRRDRVAVSYGVALMADNGLPGTGPHVHCFLTGGMVSAQDCTLYSSGRLYDAGRLAEWTRFARHDPETGDPVLAPTGGILWNDWMCAAPPPLLAWATRDVFTTLALTAKDNKGCMVTNEALVRHAVAESMGIPLRPGLDVLCAAPRASTHQGNGIVATDCAIGGSQGLAVLTPGFEHITLRHIELRHPEWDPRGKWTFGPPGVTVPDDPTMGDHERQPRGAPDQFVHSHGILSVAFDFGVSFVGARFTGVFFFGQRFECASFVAATLDRCAFVGCTFDDGCTFDRALLSGCRFYCCTTTTGGVIEIDALAKRGAIIA